MDRYDELTLLPIDEIPYAELDQDLLLRMATQDSDYFLSGNALSELTSRRSPAAAALALDILNQNTGDVYLQQQAIRVLYELDLPHFIKYTHTHMGTDNLLLLEAMIESIDFETASSDKRLAQAARLLAQRAQAIGPQRFDWVEGVQSFVSHFLPD